MSNVIQFPEKSAMTGVTLSFTVSHGATINEKIDAQVYMNDFTQAVRDLQKRGFQRLKCTLISRQEYEP